MVTEEQVRNSLMMVIDPELGINIVDLGLVYDIRIDKSEEGFVVEVEMTLTSPGCPLAPVIDKMVREEVSKIPGVVEVELDLVWDPPWGTHLMNEEVRAELGLD